MRAVSNSEPLTPDVVREHHVERKSQDIPPEVFEEFNDELLKRYDGRRTKIEQDAILKRLEGRGFERGEIFSKNMLDIEPHYREKGWDVKYERPVYYAGENFAHHWIFEHGPSPER